MLNEISGSKVFSKIDLKWGFRQIELDEESRDITTFVTHKGLYRNKRLMFGISSASAPEKYNRIILDILRGCNGVINIADDIFLHAANDDIHFENCVAVVERLKEVGLTANFEKCEFGMDKLTFFGHDF